MGTKLLVKGKKMQQKCVYRTTNRMYVMTPRDHMSHDVSYFSGPNTSGADKINTETPKLKQVKTFGFMVTVTRLL